MIKNYFYTQFVTISENFYMKGQGKNKKSCKEYFY